MDFLPRVVAHRGEVGDDGGEIARHDLLVLGGVDPRFERAGHGADAAIDAGRQEAREDVRELHRVIAPLGRAPVRGIHVFLHRALMKTAVRKSIDRERIELVLGEKLARFVDERGVAGEFRRGVMRESQAEAKPLIGRNELFHRRRFFANRLEIIRPAFARMNVQTIGEMQRSSNTIYTYLISIA